MSGIEVVGQKNTFFIRYLLILISILLLSSCENFQNKVYDRAKKHAGPANSVDAFIEKEKSSDIHHDLITLPMPRGKIVASVYNFRDQSGQYQPQPANAFSTAMPQGTLPMLMKALRESGWFNLVEREGLQNLLTERKILRATNEKIVKNSTISPLAPANIIIEGGILAYDSNIKTGGSGAKYFGLSASSQYREDQVTVGLRAVDVNTGRIINTVTAQRKLVSTQVMGGLFRFVRYKRLLELETGVTQNDPAQVVVTDAIEAAVIKLIVSGIIQSNWHLKSLNAAYHPAFEHYADPAAYQIFLNKVSKMKQAAEQKQATKKTTKETTMTAVNKAPNKATAISPEMKAVNEILASLPRAQSGKTKPVTKVKQGLGKSHQVKKKEVSNQQAVHTHKPQAKNKSLDLYPVTELLADDDLFGIQLYTAKSQKAASEFIGRFDANKEKLWIWKLPHPGGVWYIVLAGKYGDKEQAFKKLLDLPTEIQALGPWVRPLTGF